MSGSSTFLYTIEPGKPAKYYFKEVWIYKELLYFLAWRDILVRYKQTLIGISWSVLRPLLTLVIFSFLFGTVAQLPSSGVPYPLLVFAGIIPWQFFSNAVSDSSSSIISNTNLITKVYFPRIIIPASSILVAVVDMLISLVIYIVLLLIYDYTITLKVLTLPLFFIPAFIFALGCGLWLSALNVRYRDFRYVIPFLIQLSLFVSPVGFSSSVIPDKWRLLYSLNPMVGVIDGFRWALLGNTTDIYFTGFAISSVIAVLIFIGGIFYFRRMETEFADII